MDGHSQWCLVDSECRVGRNVSGWLQSVGFG